jgi:hypothetical protein
MLRILLLFLVIFLVVRLIQSYSAVTGKTNATGRNRGYSGKKEGDVTVNSNAGDKKKIISKNEGEYVDYEDV